MGGPLTNAGTFLVSTVFGLYLLIVMLRFIFAVLRIDFYNPISQFLVKATNPLLRPMRKVIPGAAGIDWSSVLLMMALKIVETTLIILILGVLPAVGALLVISAAGLLDLFLKVFLFSILIQVILSWVAPGTHNPMTSIIYQLSEPVLRPARNMLPAMGGFDLSPILVLIALQLLNILLVEPLSQMGWKML